MWEEVAQALARGEDVGIAVPKQSRSVCRKPVAVCERCGRLIWTVSQVFGSGDKFCDRPTCRGWLHWLG